MKKISKEQVFEKSITDSSIIQIEKKEAIKKQNYFFEHKNPIEFYEICEDFILNNYNRKLHCGGYLNIAKKIDEDLIIHRIDDEKDYASSIHVCFPSGWYPEEKIGKSFIEIHQPVPMNLKNSKKLVEAIVYGGIFERFVWSVVYEKKYNFHPKLNNKKFNKNEPEIFVKVERQVTVGFPEKNFCLFILRQYLIEEKQLDKKRLAESIRNMTEEQKEYKSLQNFQEIIDYLDPQ